MKSNKCEMEKELLWELEAQYFWVEMLHGELKEKGRQEVARVRRNRATCCARDEGRSLLSCNLPVSLSFVLGGLPQDGRFFHCKINKIRHFY